MANIRASILEQVALCRYVAEFPAPGKDPGDGGPVESYRKLRWKQRMMTSSSSTATSDAATPPNKENPIEHDPKKATSTDPMGVKSSPDESLEFTGNDVADVTHLTEPRESRFREFMDELVTGDITIGDIRRLKGVPTDHHGVLSIPSRREGNSLTLCLDGDGKRLLVVFGGRLLKDLTMLLPEASTIDPLKLDRVRYVFSNGVYSYDVDTSTWTLRQCAGRPPDERSDHTAVFLEPHHLVVFGGRGRRGIIYEDLFVLSLMTWNWHRVETRTTPSERYWHGCCVSEHQLFVFGGKTDVSVLGDLQYLNIRRLEQRLLQEEETNMAATTTTVKATYQQGRGAITLSQPWLAPQTVGKPPSARFGLRLLPTDRGQLLVVGGWKRATESSPFRDRPRSMDIYVLDTITWVWTRPRLSSHVCALSAPLERFNFECMHAFDSLVVFGGYTYAADGPTDPYAACADADRVVYKLDLRRMIWRRHVLDVGDEGESSSAVATIRPHMHHSDNAVLWTKRAASSDRDAFPPPHDDAGPSEVPEGEGFIAAFTCHHAEAHLSLELTALELRRRRA